MRTEVTGHIVFVWFFCSFTPVFLSRLSAREREGESSLRLLFVCFFLVYIVQYQYFTMSHVLYALCSLDHFVSDV